MSKKCPRAPPGHFLDILGRAPRRPPGPFFGHCRAIPEFPGYSDPEQYKIGGLDWRIRRRIGRIGRSDGGSTRLWHKATADFEQRLCDANELGVGALEQTAIFAGQADRSARQAKRLAKVCGKQFVPGNFYPAMKADAGT